MKSYLKEFVHNCIVHPLMMFMPASYATAMHDKNADWAFGKTSRYDELRIEKGAETEEHD
jgi:hypothetical protein